MTEPQQTERISTAIRFERSTHAALKAQADKRCVSLNLLVERAVDELLARLTNTNAAPDNDGLFVSDKRGAYAQDVIETVRQTWTAKHCYIDVQQYADEWEPETREITEQVIRAYEAAKQGRVS